jgi:Transposase DDE domain
VEETKPGKKRKKSSVKHTRAVQHDRSQRASGAPTEEAIKNQLLDIVHPATLAQVGLFQSLGLRARTLTLPVMVAMVISLIWRQMGSVSELGRVVNREAVLWVPRMKVSMQAINERLRVIPSQLFMNVLMEVLPIFRERWEARKRPLPEAMAWVRARYAQILICDGSTLDALIRKTGLLIEEAKHPLAGRMIGLLDALSRLPIWIGYTDDETAHDQRFWDDILERVTAGALLIFDLGYTNYERFAQMTRDGITFVTRAKSNMAYELAYAIERTAAVHDLVVWIGDPDTGTYQQIRSVKILYQGKWYAYLSNELDPNRLPAHVLVAVYRQRWRIEDAFLTTKSLLGLSYFFCAADNAISLQVWATWLLYAVLVDLTDMVAEALAKPFADISMEMVYRALPFYVRAAHRHETDDLLAFLVADHKLFGLVKRKRPTLSSKKRLQPPLTDDLIP